MSELEHAKIGKIYCINNTNRSRAIRTIGETQSSCVKPDGWRYPRRNGRGEVVGDVFISGHAKCMKMGKRSADRQRANRAIGEMPTSGISTYSQQNPRRNRQGGVVDCGDGFVLSRIECVSDACVVPSVVSIKTNCWHAH